MNFGILMIQGLVNSFGPAVMAAFAAAVKIDSFAYMPAQEFGNAFSLFISQNYGGSRKDRIREGTKNAFWVSTSVSYTHLDVYKRQIVSFVLFMILPPSVLLAVGLKFFHFVHIPQE